MESLLCPRTKSPYSGRMMVAVWASCSTEQGYRTPKMPNSKAWWQPLTCEAILIPLLVTEFCRRV